VFSPGDPEKQKGENKLNGGARSKNTLISKGAGWN
jgi:hypothetical protein